MDRPVKQESQNQTLFEKMREKKIAAALALGIGVSALAGCASDAEAGPKPAPSQSQEATPTETPTPTESETPEVEETLETKIEALKIPAGLSDEELAAAYIDRTNQWWTAGASDDLRMERLEANLSWDEFLPQVAAENAEAFAPALFGPDWASNPAVQERVSDKINGNITYLINYTATAWNTENPENIEAYDNWMEVEKVTLVSSSDTERTLKITYSNHNNAELNSVEDGTLIPSGATEVVFETVDGFEVAKSVQVQE